jgi:hypothetical protein
MNREAIYSALFSTIQGIAITAAVKTISRRLQYWADVPLSDQPAIFQIQRHEDPIQKRGLPTEWKLAADIYVYVNTGQDPHASPAIMLNPILDALEALFPPTSENIQTLGGLCSHCWIAGRIETSEGTLGPQEVAIVPIEILAPI